jgi:hypothetical protein
MKNIMLLLFIVEISAASIPASAQDSKSTDQVKSTKSAKEIRGASPYIAIKNEPPPKLIVDPPVREELAKGVFLAQYRVENVHIAQVFGEGALQVSPRLGHLHITVDDLPWWWADASDNNTIDLAGLPSGEHKIKISLMNANHKLFPGQTYTIKFTIPEGVESNHSH